MSAARPLDGARIVITRPQDRGESLCERINAAGGEAFHFPVIDIHAIENARLPESKPDLMIFTSIAAVEHGLPLFDSALPDAKIAAIGNATASALRAAGIKPGLVPEREESEGLLALPAFNDIAGKKIWLVKGRGGRELLANTLRDRGATVRLIEVYERRLPDRDISPLLERWRTQRIDAIVVSSRAGLENLHAMLDTEGREYLRETQLVMPTPRMLKLALEFDVEPASVIANGASDDAQLAALEGWWRDRLQDSR
ncbi:MAG TPA: uroporphyrinogen-III synthase [Gammaproteobacteria bacterium]